MGATDDVYERGRAAWPQVVVERALFERWSADRSHDRPADLYLACACDLGDRVALELLDATCIQPLAGPLARVASEADVADVLQLVRIRFLIGEAGRRPRVGEYDGSAALSVWMRVAAVRIAIDRHRRVHREAPLDALETLDGDVAPSPELVALRATYGPVFREGFASAFARLEPRERTLLRQQLIDRLGIDRLAALHRVHRATAARWIAHAREQLIELVRAELRARLALGDDELDSMFRAVESQLEVSVRWFATPQPSA